MEMQLTLCNWLLTMEASPWQKQRSSLTLDENETCFLPGHDQNQTENFVRDKNKDVDST